MIEIIIVLSFISAILFFSYTAGKATESKKGIESTLNAIQSAKDARSRLSDPKFVKWLREQRNK